MESPSPATVSGPILCRVTPWYFRRMSLMTAMLVAMGLYFLYDGRYGYPAANEIADKKDWFEQTLLKGYDEAKAENRLEEWVKETEAKGLPAGRNGEPPRWVSYAAERGWPEKPHRHTDSEITAQFWWGGATILAGLVVGVVLVLNRHKTLRAGDDHLMTPEGKKIPFSSVFKIDKRKWDNKGLAYIWHRASDAEKPQKDIIDDLKYDGAVHVLNRLMAHFKGELIEKQPENEPDTAEKISSDD